MAILGGIILNPLLKAIATLVLVVVPAFQLLRDWRFADRRTKKHHYITRAILIAWFGVALVAGTQVWMETAESRRLGADVSELKDGTNRLLTQNEQLLEDVASYQSQLDAAALRTALLEADLERARRGFVSTLDFWGRRHETSPQRKGVYYRDEYKAFERMRRCADAERWEELISLCETWMQRRPDWPTAYMFAGIAHDRLGHVETAIVLLEFVERHWAGDENYKPALDLLAHLRGDSEPAD